MKITNKYNLPEVLFRALSAVTYKRKSKYSVSSIIKEPRQVLLENRHQDEIEQDITENLWKFLGSSVHNFLELGEGKNDLIEERLYYRSLSGQFDNYDGEQKILSDFKITSVWNFIYGEFLDWQKQLSIYAFLLERLGFEVKKIRNIMIFRDWKKADHENGKYDVPAPILVLEHEKLTHIEEKSIQSWIDEKINELESLEQLSDSQLPLCSEKSRWAEEGKYKIFWNESTSKNPSSIKNFSEHEKAAAEEFLKESNGKGKGKKTYRLEYLPGDKYKKCKFCSVSQFCNQFQDSQK